MTPTQTAAMPPKQRQKPKPKAKTQKKSKAPESTIDKDPQNDKRNAFESQLQTTRTRTNTLKLKFNQLMTSLKLLQQTQQRQRPFFLQQLRQLRQQHKIFLTPLLLTATFLPLSLQWTVPKQTSSLTIDADGNPTGMCVTPWAELNAKDAILPLAKKFGHNWLWKIDKEPTCQMHCQSLQQERHLWQRQNFNTLQIKGLSLLIARHTVQQ